MSPATSQTQPDRAPTRTRALIAALTFIVPQNEKPYFENSALTGGVLKVDFRTNELSVSVQDMRPLAPDLSLDREGFKLCACPTAVDNLYDDADATTYNVEVEAPLKKATGAARAA